MKLLNYGCRVLMTIFAAITFAVAVVPYGLTMLFVYLDELTDK